MPASKKRIQNRGTLNADTQQVPTALKDWMHIWHGVTVRYGLENTSIFHAGSRIEKMPFWKQFIRLPSKSLFPRVFTRLNPRKPYKDFLYVLLNMRWPMLLVVLLAVFLANIFFFAAVTCFICGEPRDFFEAFNLSYQTFTTIGFGVVYPTKTCGNVSMSVESFASMMVVSTLTGLVFAKFAKPQAKIAFSKVCVVQPYGKKYLALVVRVANATQSQDVTHDVIMEAAFKINLLRVEHKTKQARAHDDKVTLTCRPTNCTSMTPNDDNVVNDAACATKVLTSYNLKLLQYNFITFRMGVAVVHLIDESSPLYGMSRTDLAQSDMLVEVAMTGVDSTLQDTVSERYIYTAANLMWGYRFAKLIEFNEQNAEVIMNFAKLSTVDSAPIDNARYLTSLLSRSLPRVSPKTVNEGTHDVTHRRSHRKLRLSPDAEGKFVDFDQFRLSLSWDGQSSDTDDDTPVFYRPLHGPQMFAMGLEPLSEPLLHQLFGTQRIPKALTAEKHAVQRGGLQNWRENELEYGQVGRSGKQLTSRDDLNARALYGSGASHNCDVMQDSCEGRHGFRSKKWLHQEMAGTAMIEDDASTISHEEGHKAEFVNPYEVGDVVDDDIDDVVDDDHNSDDGRKNDTTLPRQPIERMASALSIEIEDTPRFLRILPVHIPKSFSFMRFYQSALHVCWPKIIFVFVLLFLVINFSFGLLYWFASDHIAVYNDMAVSKYELAFYMSVHTLATIGYGSIAPMPRSAYMNVVVFVESMIGIITVTLITGIAWSKFARPRAHIYFSSKMTISTIFGHRCLVFRAANTRRSGEVHDIFFRIGVILTNRRTGLRQMYDVPLLTVEWPSIKLPVTLIHVINENSPFHKFCSMKDLSQSRVAVIALLTGLDTTFSENVYARKMYFWDDFAYDMRFDDCAVIERGRVIVDYERFDRLIREDRDEQIVTTPVLSMRTANDN